MSTITLRQATVRDVPMLRYWDTQEHFFDSIGEDDWEWETQLSRTIPWRKQLIAQHNGRPIGYLEILDPALEETHYWGIVEPNRRAMDIWLGDINDFGRGYGSKIMRHGLAICFADPCVEAVLIDPFATNTDAIRFYRRLGFVSLGVRTLGESKHVCEVHVMPRTRWQADFQYR